jgi:hypothetical protein
LKINKLWRNSLLQNEKFAVSFKRFTFFDWYQKT